MTWLDSPVNKADWFCYSSVFLNSYPTVNKPCYWINYSVNQCVCNRRPLQQGDHVLLMLLRNWLNSFIELCLHELPKAPHSPEPEENPMHFSVNPFLYCEAVGFIISECPVRPPHLQVRYIHTLLVIHSPLCTKLTVIRSYITLIAMALLDFGSAKGCGSIVCSSKWRSVSFSSLWSIFSAIISVLGELYNYHPP